MRILSLLTLAIVVVLCHARPRTEACSWPGRSRGAGDYLCGPKCLTFCARWLGTEADVTEVAKQANTKNPEGTSLADLAKVASELGLEGGCYRLGLDDLRRVTSQTPGIAHVDGDHFVVVWMSADDEVTVVEPPQNVTKMPLRTFGRRWDGMILVVSQPGDQPRWTSLVYRNRPLALLAAVGVALAWILRRKSQSVADTGADTA